MRSEESSIPNIPDDADSLRILLRWAIAPPDEDLVRRYFADQADLGSLLDATLTNDERRHVVASLNVNPEWQAVWRHLEEEYGLSVEWPRMQHPGTIHPLTPFWALRAVRLTAAAMFALLVLYGALWTVSQVNRTEVYVMASLEAHQHQLEERLRSDSANTRGDFEQGIQALLDAQRSTLGLFPGYDPAKVREAVRHLTNALDHASTGFQRGEISFLLAKAALMQNDTAEARRQLEYLRGLAIDWRSEYYGDDVETLWRDGSESP